jgi:hypothetical protein
VIATFHDRDMHEATDDYRMWHDATFVNAKELATCYLNAYIAQGWEARLVHGVEHDPNA